jgi:cellulose synthase/poly-beta-1,6-N-acetylglucosamine synthase-like glycosyltransferase
MRAMRALRFHLLFGAALAVLVAGIVLGFAGRGPWAWTIGLTYIAYDSWLLLAMVVAAFRVLRQPKPEAQGEAGTMTVLVCARDERAVLPACLAALRAQTAPAEEVVVVDDGSRDGSAAWLRGEYRLDEREASAVWPGLRLLALPHGGKARALNAAIATATGDLVVTLDADTLLEPGALAAVRAAFAADPNLVAAGGVLTPRCRGGRLGPVFEFYQTFEYLRSFLWRLVWARGSRLLLISGAFAIFRRPVLVELGGFRPESVVEDYEFVYRLHRRTGDLGLGWRTGVIAGARAVTDVPSAVPNFLRQRMRWFFGFLETLFLNRDMVGDGRYGSVGRYMLPLKVVDALLPIYALLTAALLVGFVIVGKSWDRWVVGVIVGKIVFDLVCHALSVFLYQRWQGIPGRLWLGSVAATLSEPFGFQLLRHLGAVLGWIAFLRGRVDWTPQRAPVK